MKIKQSSDIHRYIILLPQIGFDYGILSQNDFNLLL